jgi:NAD-dependent deacetylase
LQRNSPAVRSRAADLLAGAARVTVLTGAGVSAESGIDTFRGPDGTWSRVDVEAVATPEGFRRNPRRVWEWYEERRRAVRAAAPNPGHLALARLEELRAATVVTQNIDGLHARAGSKRVVEVHGSLWRVRCAGCAFAGLDERVPLPESPPRCPSCGGLLRPDVVWFGEPIPPAAWRASLDALEISDAFLLAGTSAVVTPAADLAEMALRRGIPLIEVNLDPTPYSDVATVSLRGRAGDLLPELVRRIEKFGAEGAEPAE